MRFFVVAPLLALATAVLAQDTDVDAANPNHCVHKQGSPCSHPGRHGCNEDRNNIVSIPSVFV